MVDSDTKHERIRAMQAAIKAQAENGSWTLVTRMKYIRSIGCKCEFLRSVTSLDKCNEARTYRYYLTRTLEEALIPSIRHQVKLTLIFILF